MPWTKVDDAMCGHPKLHDAGRILGRSGKARALATFVECLTFARTYLTGGLIRAVDLECFRIDPQPAKVVEALAKVGLLDVVDGGWQIHDYEPWYGDDGDTKAARESSRPSRGRSRGRGRDRASDPDPDPDPEQQQQEQPRLSDSTSTNDRKTTAKQRRGIEHMAHELGETVEVPETEKAAGALFADLKARVEQKRRRAGRRGANAVDDAEAGTYRDFK